MNIRRRVGRRILGATTALVAGVAAVALLPTPSQAVASPEFEQGTSAYSSTNFKNATARCDFGEQVYGASYRVTDGLGKVAVNTLLPNEALTEVFVEANETDSGITSSWSVTAEAICGPPNSNLKRERVIVPNSSSTDKSATVPCTGGRKVYGGGFIFPLGYGQVFMTWSFGNSNLLAWNVRAVTDNNNGLVWGVEAFAICGPQAATHVAQTQSDFANDSTSPKEEDVGCPTGTKLHGPGVVSSGATGQVVIEDMTPASLVLLTATVKAFENDSTTAGWFSAAHGICAS
ncbi:hypothetical protein ACTMTJ_03200 [Phytohabitans sp. LJ34]|uniref:hypothetical protein n=1 Tax=Phytohabitans sp. LJ34 TaxID=3452217 RepID=UPI003F8982BA